MTLIGGDFCRLQLLNKPLVLITLVCRHEMPQIYNFDHWVFSVYHIIFNIKQINKCVCSFGCVLRPTDSETAPPFTVPCKGREAVYFSV